MTHGESDPLKTLRYVRYMQAIKGWATIFVGTLLLGLTMYAITAMAIGTSVPLWLAVTVLVVMAAIAGGINLYLNYGEVFGV